MTLSYEDALALRWPFRLDDHRFDHEWPYLTEGPIEMRLDEVDPAWSWVIKSIETREVVGSRNEFKITVHGSLTIKGVTRDGVGQAITRQSKPKTAKDTGEMYTDEINSAEKSAATDALKRAARLFGIGRYLLATQKAGIKTKDQLERWLNAAVDKAKSNGHVELTGK
jgi:hypothetical protein